TRVANTPEHKTGTCIIPLTTYIDPIASLDETEIFHETFVDLPDGWSIYGHEGEYLYEADNGLQLQTKGGHNIRRAVWVRYLGDDTPDNMLTESLVFSEESNVYVGHTTGSPLYEYGYLTSGVWAVLYPD